MSYKMKYKKFDQLLSEVKSDFEGFALDNAIKTHQMIRVAKRVNYDLGLKINKTKNVILTVENGKAKLPDDFYLVNVIYGLGQYEMKDILPQGTHVEEVPLPVPTYFQNSDTIDVCATPDPCPPAQPVCPDPCDPCAECSSCNPCQSPNPCGCNTCNCDTWINCKGQEMTLIQRIKYQTRRWTEFYKITLLGDDQFYDPLCPNLLWHSGQTAQIRDDQWVYFTFKEGEVYLNYEALMVDDDGDLVVLKHDEIDNYYEYALKKKILESLLVNGENVNAGLVKLIHEEYRISRLRAKSIINTPDFKTIRQGWEIIRRSAFNKYYSAFY